MDHEAKMQLMAIVIAGSVLICGGITAMCCYACCYFDIPENDDAHSVTDVEAGTAPASPSPSAA
ncbi:MAG: hypothetical protein P1U40_00610 [Coxiellaceae bacterium]|nr:hypothetical protein [Coxiellaceae bacterium]